nr:type IA DNA topoisomerase [Dyadobacter sp. NIV53]
MTYPRVDTTYLSEDLHPKMEGIMKDLTQYSQYTALILEKPIPKLKTIFDDKKVTDHHAIIPTGVQPVHISQEERQIYDLIVRRYLAAFYPECRVSNTTVMGKVGQVEFKATGKQILDPGWRAVYITETNTKKEEEEKVMPNFVAGETGPHEPWVHQGKTSPPKYYSEATLLRAMETAGKQVEDEEMRELLKDNGIGRPSTRANIIETLFKRRYIEKNKKNLIATQTGMDLIDTIQNELLKSAELTGNWERKLRLIEKGEYSMETFKQELIQMVVDITTEVKMNTGRMIFIKEDTIEIKEEKPKKEAKPKEPKEEISIESLTCPKCKSYLLKKGKTAYGCGNFQVCGFKIPFEFLGKQLNDKNVFDLLSKGRTAKIKGLAIPGNPEPVNAKLVMTGEFNFEVE